MTRPSLSSYSRLVQRVRRRYADLLPLLPVGLPAPQHLHTTFAALTAAGHDTACALRITRQLVLERLVCLDCDQAAPLKGITQAMTDLAEFALGQAINLAHATLAKTHGLPMTADHQNARLWVLGMGKLGARELNVSSDIDLIYICLLYTSPSPRDRTRSRMPSSA